MAMKPVNDKIVSRAINAQVNLMRYETTLRNQIKSRLVELRKELIQELSSNAGTTFSRARVTKMLDELNAVIETAYKDMKKMYDVSMLDIARVQKDVAADIINMASGITLVESSLTDAKLRSVISNVLIEGAPSAEWWARMQKGMVDKFADQIRLGVLRNATIGDLVDRVSDPSGGLFNTATRNVEALVRTSVMTLSNDIRDEVYQENRDLFKGIQWVSTLDDRTTETCMALDGLEWDMDYNPIGHSTEFPGPTAHWGCRSTQVPVLKSFSELSENKRIGKILDRAERNNPGTRASMNGQVSAKLTYEDWLAQQSKSTQKEILGPGRYELWSKNKLGVSDLVNQTGRPITLEELRRRRG